VATSPCIARTASRPSAVPAARHGRPTAKSTSARARDFPLRADVTRRLLFRACRRMTRSRWMGPSSTRCRIRSSR
jgi:hypothetical protein